MQIPAKWVAILAAIQAVAPEAFLAGGALRDLDLGREVKDLDIFVSAEGYGPARSVLAGLGYLQAGRQCVQYSGADTSVEEAREFALDGELPVNLICLKADYAFPAGLARFDLGLCQIGFDGSELVRTAAYVEDAQHRRMTVRRCNSSEQFKRTEMRAARLSVKYPEWMLTVPAEFNAYTDISEDGDFFG